jgi:hypothetical protein
MDNCPFFQANNISLRLQYNKDGIWPKNRLYFLKERFPEPTPVLPSLIPSSENAKRKGTSVQNVLSSFGGILHHVMRRGIALIRPEKVGKQSQDPKLR